MTTKVTIDRLGHRGDGVAQGPIFAAGTLPGEIVEGNLAGDRLNDIKIITPSTERVRPPCPHFKSCGGCSLQHASEEFLADWKAGIVRAALSAHGLRAPIRNTFTSPARSRRRATLAGRRTKKGATVGLHARASEAIIDIQNCQLLHPELMGVVPALQELTVAGGSRKAELAFSVTRSGSGVDVAVSGGKDLTGILRIRLAALSAKGGLARLSWGGELIAEHAAPVQTFGNVAVTPPSGAFLQATEQGQAALVEAVSQAVLPARRIVDLFAGCGTFALSLAEQAEIHAVEGDGEMLAALDAGWRRGTGMKKITTEVRDLFRRPLTPAEIERFEAVVIDPPRTGAEAQMPALAQTNLPIAFVSCNPATFARDARTLCDSGYTFDWIDIIDQFRWSPHVELIAQLSKK